MIISTGLGTVSQDLAALSAKDIAATKADPLTAWLLFFSAAALVYFMSQTKQYKKVAREEGWELR